MGTNKYSPFSVICQMLCSHYIYVLAWVCVCFCACASACKCVFMICMCLLQTNTHIYMRFMHICIDIYYCDYISRRRLQSFSFYAYVCLGRLPVCASVCLHVCLYAMIQSVAVVYTGPEQRWIPSSPSQRYASW